MKVNRFQRQLLRFINDKYSVPWKDSDTHKIIAIGERDVPSMTDIKNRFPSIDEMNLSKNLETLVNHQYIHTFNLLDKSDYQEMMLAVGSTTRARSSRGGPGLTVFQITTEGKSIIEGFWDSIAWRILYNLMNKLSQDYILYFIMFIIGVVISSIFGFDIKKYFKN